MATQYSNKPIVTDGLVYALDFGNQKSYVSGSTTGNNLKYSPTPSSFLRAGNPGGVDVINNLGQFTINGTTGSFVTLNMPSNPIAYGGVFTLMYIGKPKSGDSGYFYGASTGGYPLFYFSGQEFDASGYYTGRGYPGNDSLQFITVLHSSGSYEQYINGMPQAPTGFAGGNASPSDPPHLSGRSTSQFPFTGSLGCFLVYNRKLTADEIWQNYQILAPKYGLSVPVKPYSIDPNAYLFLSQSGITDPIITGSIDTFVRGLKSAGIWDKMVGIYPFVGTGSAGVNLTGSQRWNLKEPSTATYGLTFTGTWIGSTSGSTPSGSNTNITIGQIEPRRRTGNAASSLIDQNNVHISILSYDTPVSNSYLMGTGMTEDLAISTLAGDYGTPAAAYSVRKVRTAYSGALMDVRRSYDNVTSSIGYVSNGDLDTGSLLDWTIPGRSTLPGAYSGLAAAYSLRKVSSSYSGSAIQANNGLVYRDIGFDSNGNLNTGSLTSLVATGSNVLAGNYSGLAAAYSLRRVTSSYSGFAIEVQSGSVSQSIGFDSFGNLDTGSLLTFVGSGNGFVKTWYDQSGNNNHATASSDTQQPIIVSSGSILTVNGKPSMYFDGINDQLNMAGLHGQSVLDTYFVTSTSDTQYLYPNTGTAGNYGFVSQNGSTSTGLITNYGLPSLYANGTLFTGTTRTNVYNFLTGSKVVIHQGASTSGWVQYSFGNYNDYQYSGSLQELIAFTSSQAANRTYIENNINAYYNIYTTSSTSTENAFVSTWYDQSGNNRHATQTTSSSQPLIVSSGSLITENGKPALRFLIANSSSLNLPGSPLSGSNAFGLYAVANFLSVDKYEMLYAEETSGNIVEIRRDNLNNTLQWSTGVGTVPSGTASIDNRQILVSVNRNALVSNSAFVNGTLDATSTTSSNSITSTTASIGKRTDGFYFDGTVQEMSFFTGSAASSSRSLIENNINNYYNIYTGSNHGFVARWYDQSGNNRHASQTATGSQPMIVLSGSIITENSRSALSFDGTSMFFNLSSNITATSPFSSFAVGRRSSNGTAMLFYGGSGVIHGLSPDDKYYLQKSTGYLQSNNTDTTNQQILLSGIATTATQSQFKNSLEIASTFTAAGIATTVSKLGYYVDASPYYFNGKYQELSLYLTDQSSNRQPIEYGINSYYNIYPQTSSFATSSFAIYTTSGSVSASLNNKLTSGIPSSGPLGLITVSRTGSNSLTIARNGVTSSFAVPASGALSTGIYLGAINNNGIALGNSPLNIEYASIGTGLTNNEISTYTSLTYNFRNNFRGYDRDAVTFLNALGTATSYLTLQQQSSINTLVTSLKSANLWDKFQVIYPFIGGTRTSHGFNLKNPQPTPAAHYMTFTGGTHNSTGYSQNGNGGFYGLTNYNPSVNLLNVSSSHISLYVPILNTEDGYDFGTANAGTFGIALRTPWGQMAVGLGGVSAAISPPAHGYFIGSRIGTTTVMTRYSGSTVVSGSGTGTTYSYPNYNAQLGSLGYGATTRFYSFLTIGSGLTLDERNQLNSIVQAYQTSLGRQV